MKFSFTGKARDFMLRNKHKLFYFYAAYGFGVPLIIVAFVGIVDNLKSVPNNYKPGFGINQCFIDGMYFLEQFY